MENEVSLDELYFHTSQKDCRTKYNVNLHSKDCRTKYNVNLHSKDCGTKYNVNLHSKDCGLKYNVNLHSKMNHLTVVQTFLAEIVDLVQMIEHFLRPAFIPMTIL